MPDQVGVSCAEFESGYNGIVQACQHQANVKTALIVGSVIGGVVGLVVVGGVLYYYVCPKHHRNARKEAPERRAAARHEISEPTEVVIDRTRAVDDTEV